MAQAAGGGKTRAVYARKIGLLGVTLAKNIAGSSIGTEVSHRSNGPLISNSAAARQSNGYKGARGDTWHALINSEISFGPSPLYHSAQFAF
ncbi:MAG: DUF1302 family protein [Proteobacteria bacterium]|nr:DUF1302 family protein [Pseudomonadota bacterium]